MCMKTKERLTKCLHIEPFFWQKMQKSCLIRGEISMWSKENPGFVGREGGKMEGSKRSADLSGRSAAFRAGQGSPYPPSEVPPHPSRSGW